MRDLEVVRRRLDAVTDALAGRLDVSGAYRADGHRSAKAAIKHLGRLPGAEAHARVRTARRLRQLPAVAAAYDAGTIPTASVRAIVRAASNPRVEAFLEVADPVYPADALAAALAGHVRRLVVDAAGTVIDLGRKRRCFTGASRDAAHLQTALRHRGGPACFWSACDAAPHWLQVDHHQPWRARGPTTPAA